LRHKRKALSGLEGLLEIVGFEVMVEGVRTGTHSMARGREFEILGAATLKLWVPNEVRIYGTDSKLLFDNLYNYENEWNDEHAMHVERNGECGK